jgi:hypothetical protein
MNLVQSSFPMERIATDILGELPETEDGNRYILVVSFLNVKHFTDLTEQATFKLTPLVRVYVRRDTKSH